MILTQLFFYLLTNKLYRFEAFENIESSKRTNSNSAASFGLILDCYNRKNNSDCNQPVFFQKFRAFFMLIKEQNNAHQSSLLIGPNIFRNSFKVMCPFSLLERLWSF